MFYLIQFLGLTRRSRIKFDYIFGQFHIYIGKIIPLEATFKYESNDIIFGTYNSYFVLQDNPSGAVEFVLAKAYAASSFRCFIAFVHDR